MTTDMLIPFLIMVAGFTLTFYWLLLRRLQAEISSERAALAGFASWWRRARGE